MAFWKKSKKATPDPAERAEKIRSLLDMVSFDNSGWKLEGDDIKQMMRQWITSEEDVVSLHFSPVPPDLPTTQNLEDFHRYLTEMLQDVRGSIVELETRPVAGMDVLRQIVKFPIPDREHGLVYIGSYTLPFKNFSYVVKAQCVEHGTTGTREAILFAQQRGGSANRSYENDKVVMPDWNPDAPEFDLEFADHPLSRLRRDMEQIETSLRIIRQFRRGPFFPLPPTAHGRT